MQRSLEATVVPAAVDRAKQAYARAGFALEVDVDGNQRRLQMAGRPGVGT
jgi:hypothetical protein